MQRVNGLRKLLFKLLEHEDSRHVRRDTDLEACADDVILAFPGLDILDSCGEISASHSGKVARGFVCVFSCISQLEVAGFSREIVSLWVWWQGDCSRRSHDE